MAAAPQAGKIFSGWRDPVAAGAATEYSDPLTDSKARLAMDRMATSPTVMVKHHGEQHEISSG